MYQVQGQNPIVVSWTGLKTSWTHKQKLVELSLFFFFFNLSVVPVMEIADSNFNQHLLLFQHIPLVKGNDDFPVSDYNDTDMNLENYAYSFQPHQDVILSISF